MNRNRLIFDVFSAFTDGSGVYFSERYIRLSYRLPTNYIVFQAEVPFVLKAVIVIEWNIAVRQDVEIYVDSQAPLKALARHLVKSSLVSDCRASLYRKPDHHNIESVEVTDELAKQGWVNQSVSIDRSVKPPISHFYWTIREWILGKST